MVRSLAVIVVVAAILAALASTLDLGTEKPGSPEPLPQQGSTNTEKAVEQPEPATAKRQPADLPDPPRKELGHRAGDLGGLHESNLQKVNRVLKKAGRATIQPDAKLTADELAMMHDMVSASDKAINKAADAVLDFQGPHADEMIANIKQAVDSGSKPPYEVLPNGRLPKRGPYDLLITSSYQGVVYAHKVPVSQALLNTVDAQRLAETLRLDAYTQFAARFQ